MTQAPAAIFKIPTIPHRSGELRKGRMVVRGGVEPPTFRFSGGRSYRLSYLTEARCSRAVKSTPWLQPLRS